MISLASIWAVALRHIRILLQGELNLALFLLYWPVLDILIWGFLGSWIQQAQAAQLPNYTTAALLGILLWQVVGRGSNIMVTSFSEEIWSNSVVTLFSLPLRTIEWMVGIVLFYIIMQIITTITCMLVMLMLYEVSLSYVLSTFLTFLPPLIFSSIWIGFTSLQIIVTLGRRGAELGQVIAWFLLPFTGAYYPIEVLPHWGQVISKFLPMSYVFQGMRGYVMYQQDPTPYLIKGYLLSIPYAICALLLFVYCFNRSKRQGLARLAD